MIHNDLKWQKLGWGAVAALALFQPATGTAQFTVPAEEIAVHTWGVTGFTSVDGFLSLEDGSILVGGVYQGSLPLPTGGDPIILPSGGGGIDAFATRIDPDTGYSDWAFTMTGENSIQGFRFAPLDDGNFFIRGSIEGPGEMDPVAPGVDPTYETPPLPGSVPPVFTKVAYHGVLSPDGVLESYDLGMGDYSNFSTAIVPGRDNTAFALGTTRQDLTFNIGLPTELRLPRVTAAVDAFDTYLIRMDAESRVLWGRITWGLGEDSAGALASYPDGGVIGTGRYQQMLVFNVDEDDEYTLGPANNQDGWVARWDEDGNLIWARGYGGSNRENFLAVESLPDGDIIVAGYAGPGFSVPRTTGGNFTPTIRGAQDSFVMRIRESDGAARWVSTLTSLGNLDAAWGVAVDPEGGRVWIGGDYYAALLSGTSLIATHSGGGDGYVAEFDLETGRYERIFTVQGSSGRDQVFKVDFVPDGRLIFAGDYSPTAQLQYDGGSRPLAGTGTRDAFLAIFDVGAVPPPPNFEGWMLR